MPASDATTMQRVPLTTLIPVMTPAPGIHMRFFLVPWLLRPAAQQQAGLYRHRQPILKIQIWRSFEC